MLERSKQIQTDNRLPDKSSGRLIDLLQIVLITYNRYFFLEQTLSQLADSPFRNVKITIFDNNSSDRTPEVCECYSKIFPNFSIIRHTKNIGGNANYLRAIEYLTYEYGWVLCDDDTFDFSSAEQVIQVIENREYDVIYVAAREELTLNPATSRSALDLLAAKDRLHHAFSFFPSIIFKTSLYDETSVRKGYYFIVNLYPNFPFLNKLIACNARIFIPFHAVVLRNNTNSSGFSGLFWYSAWINCTQSIQDRRLRSLVIHDATFKHGFLKSLAFWIAFDKTNDPVQFWTIMRDIAWGLPWHRRIALLLLFPLMLIPIPPKYLLALRRQVYLWMGVNDIPPTEIQIRN